MIHKTRGIVLHQIKYSDNSIIVTIYTELFGRQSYIIKGVHNKKSKIKSNLFQPLYLLEMDAYYKPNKNIQNVKEIQSAYIFSSMPYDIRKSSIALFIAEILYKTLQEHEANKDLFNYLFHSIQLLDLKDDSISNFHLYFLVHLSKYLGFFPNNNYSQEKCYFDLRAGSFMQIKPMHNSCLEKGLSKIFSQLLTFSENQHQEIELSHSERMFLLEKLVEFYSLHHEGVVNIKSLGVLKEVLH